MENVEAIVVTFQEGGTSTLSSFEALSNMKKLRLLMILGCFDLPESGCSTPRLDYLSNNLRLLEWNKFPFKEFPATFRPEKLVKLKLTKSNLERLFRNKTMKVLFGIFLIIIIIRIRICFYMIVTYFIFMVSHL